MRKSEDKELEAIAIMLIIGLTGSIGMGKTTVANDFAERGVPVLAADDIVHQLYNNGEVAPHIEAAFTGTTRDGKVDRAALSAALLDMPGGFAKLDALVHPLVRRAQWRFLQDQAAKGTPFVVLDIPLLFETAGNDMVDISLVVSAPARIQMERVMQRPGMAVEKVTAILARQLPDAEKRARADVVLNTGVAWEETQAAIGAFIASLGTQTGGAFEKWRRRFG